MLGNVIRTVTVAALLLGWSRLAPRLPVRWAVPAGAALGTGLAVWTRAPLGLRSPEVRDGLRTGLGAVGVVSAAVAASTAVPAVRAAMAAREMPDDVATWLALRIPVGTVWAEETGYRAALGTVAAQSLGPTWGRVAQAVVFGLSHVPDARGAGDPVAGTVLVTGVAGWLFGSLHDRTGSLAAPMLAHLAVNEAGAVAALVVQRRRQVRVTG